jgi:hypothetical protein
MQFGSNEQISKFHLLTATPTIALPDFLALGGSSAAVVRRRGVNAVLRKKASVANHRWFELPHRCAPS